jgi:putative transposase
VAFIDAHKQEFGVGPICGVLTQHGAQIAPSTYYAARSRPPSPRALRDADLLVEIQRIFSDRDLGRGLYGARKVWLALRREGIEVARCTVERLMRSAGLRGVRRGKQVVITRPWLLAMSRYSHAAGAGATRAWRPRRA